ncbi:MAG: hypothetical protein HYU67_14000 [Flavobacteriia bacterium]|nr:hypothetical protein [Flavobacteriia bacterium]
MKKLCWITICVLFTIKLNAQSKNTITPKKEVKNNNHEEKKLPNNIRNNIQKNNLNTSLTGKPEPIPQNISNGIPKRGFAVDWITPKPNTNEKITLFSKIELGVHLPDTFSQKIEAFVNNIDGSEKINPFNPEEINIVAHFEFLLGKTWKKESQCFGFFYQDYQRIVNQENIQNWNWEKIKTNAPFRIRYSPTKIGKWRVLVIVYYKGIEQARMGEFEFSCAPGKNKGYVKVSRDNKGFALGKESYLPIGQNLAKPTCFLQKDKNGNIISDPYSCAKVPCAGEEDWCSKNKNLPLHPKAYMTYIEEINNLKKSGANTYRMLIYPFTYEIEFEKLGDYSSRMHCAWELDKMIETAEKNNMKINLNLFVGYSVSKAPYGVKHWDWYDDGNDDIAYCYKSSLQLKDPVEFLTHPLAKKHFKNRLRYYISRYSYSTSIAWWEIMSEINQKFPDNPKEVYSWQKEMLSYIKNELGCEQLLALNYDGKGPDSTNGDLSFTIPQLDIMALSVHRLGNSRADLQQLVNKYQLINKPLIFSEIGTGDSEVENCGSHTEWIKDLWMTYFVGTSTTGFNWSQQHDYELWKKMNALKTYFNSLDLNHYPNIQVGTRSDNLIEIITRKDTSNSKIMGIIQNLTWNYQSMSNDESCKQKGNISKEHIKFTSVKPEKKKKSLSIDVKPETEFFIEWFDPFAGKVIDTISINSTAKGKLELHFPILDEQKPILVFKCYNKKDPISKSAPKMVKKLDSIELKSNNPVNQNKGKLEDK